jgi:hypothetical protein
VEPVGELAVNVACGSQPDAMSEQGVEAICWFQAVGGRVNDLRSTALFVRALMVEDWVSDHAPTRT